MSASDNVIRWFEEHSIEDIPDEQSLKFCCHCFARLVSVGAGTARHATINPVASA